MATAVAPTEEALRTLCAREHRHCFACRAVAKGGLGLVFRVTAGGGVAAQWQCPAGYESFEGILHGGIIATVLDSAMVHALFAHGVSARTGSLNLRYRVPAVAEAYFTVTAELDHSYPPLYVVNATLAHAGTVCATARGKFMSSTCPSPSHEDE